MIARFARRLRAEARNRGLRMSTVTHSPMSHSVYYTIEDRARTWEFQVRISDHELWRISVYQNVDVIVSEGYDEDAAMAMALDELDCQIEYG